MRQRIAQNQKQFGKKAGKLGGSFPEEVALTKDSCWRVEKGALVRITLEERIKDVLLFLGDDTATFDKMKDIAENGARAALGAKKIAALQEAMNKYAPPPPTPEMDENEFDELRKQIEKQNKRRTKEEWKAATKDWQ